MMYEVKVHLWWGKCALVHVEAKDAVEAARKAVEQEQDGFFRDDISMAEVLTPESVCFVFERTPDQTPIWERAIRVQSLEAYEQW